MLKIKFSKLNYNEEITMLRLIKKMANVQPTPKKVFQHMNYFHSKYTQIITKTDILSQYRGLIN